MSTEAVGAGSVVPTVTTQPEGPRLREPKGDSDPGSANSENRDRIEPSSSGSRSRSDSVEADEVRPVTGCLVGLSEAECEDLEAAVAAGNSRKVGEGKCLPGLSRAECITLEQAVEAAESTGEVADSDEGANCPSGLSKSQCEELAGG